MKEVMYAFGTFEIGDTYQDTDGKLHTITDVLICYYVSSDAYKIRYEVDNNGEFISLVQPISVKEDGAKPHFQIIGPSR